jgi:hypothetical protein
MVQAKRDFADLKVSEDEEIIILKRPKGGYADGDERINYEDNATTLRYCEELRGNPAYPTGTSEDQSECVTEAPLGHPEVHGEAREGTFRVEARGHGLRPKVRGDHSACSVDRAMIWLALARRTSGLLR